MPNGGTQPSACESIQRSMKEVLRRFQAAESDLSPESFEDGDDNFGRGNVPLLCPLQELAQGGAVEEEWCALKKRHEDVSRRLTAAKHALASALPVHATRLSALKNQMLKLQLRAHASAIRAKAQESHVVILRDELRKMKQVRLTLSDATSSPCRSTYHFFFFFSRFFVAWITSRSRMECWALRAGSHANSALETNSC